MRWTDTEMQNGESKMKYLLDGNKRLRVVKWLEINEMLPVLAVGLSKIHYEPMRIFYIKMTWLFVRTCMKFIIQL